MNKIVFLVGLIFTVSTLTAQPQNRSEMPDDGIIHGSVIDNSTNKPIEYANVVLYSVADSSIVSGSVSDVNGKFTLSELPYGRYYIVANFIGYEKITVNQIAVNPRNKSLVLEPIKLSVASNQIDQVNVVADRAMVEYHIDKKVVNVSQNLNAQGGSAVEALENVPSINVDIEGNVELRGSENFTVLIDGRPTVLSGSDALRQIPASTIENIEIITNPSAKYDPEGVSGIVNVIMKKQKQRGYNGVVNASIGTNDKYTTDFLLNLRTGKFNFIFGANYRTSPFSFDSEMTRETYRGDTTIFLDATINRVFNHGGYGVKSGFDYYINDRNTVQLQGSYGRYMFDRDINFFYNSWASYDMIHEYKKNENVFYVGGNYYTVSFDFQHQFEKPEHKLALAAYYSSHSGDDDQDVVQYVADSNFSPLNIEPAQYRTAEEANRTSLRLKLDYTNKFSEKSKLEAGYQSELNNSDADYVYENFDNELDLWYVNTNYTNLLETWKYIHSAYVTYSNQFAGFEFLVGLRGEYTDRAINQLTTDEEYSINRLDMFPTLHISRQLLNKQQIQASYSKRIHRPDDRMLNPFPMNVDEFNISVGNPKLEPEYTHALELNYQKRYDVSYISVEAYYRYTYNEFSRTATPNEQGALVRTVENMDNEDALGIESMANLSLFKWWEFAGGVNFYRYSIEGNVADRQVSAHSINWDFRLNNTFTITPSTRLQVTARYQSGSATEQGESKGSFMSSITVRQDLFKRKFSISLAIQDPLRTGKRENYINDPAFYAHETFRRESPVIMLNLSYRINNYKPERDRANGEDGNMEMEM